MTPQGPIRWISDHHIPDSEYLTGHLKAAMEKAPKKMLGQSYFHMNKFHYNMALKKILNKTDMRVEWAIIGPIGAHHNVLGVDLRIAVLDLLGRQRLGRDAEGL